MTWKQRKSRTREEIIAMTEKQLKTSPKQALQREWFVRQGQILGGFHCLHASALQLGNIRSADKIATLKCLLLIENDEWFAREKEKLNAPK